MTGLQIHTDVIWYAKRACVPESNAGATVVIEQPASSILSYHPKFSLLIELSQLGWWKLSKLHVWMGLYGSHSPKSTELWTTHAWSEVLSRQSGCYCTPWACWWPYTSPQTDKSRNSNKRQRREVQPNWTHRQTHKDRQTHTHNTDTPRGATWNHNLRQVIRRVMKQAHTT